MKVATFTESKIGNLKSKLISYGRLVRFSHTVFALPFALSSVALAWPKHPVTLRGLFWILMAMVCARTAAMGFNRLADRKFDALNPRTRNWELPRGSVTVRGAVTLTIGAAVLFVIAAYQLNWICLSSRPSRC
jgi:4-hydroxybenzoate polyprenyltransferase